MGRKASDGKAVDVVAPAGQYDFGELFRIDGFTGVALSTINTADTDRGLALEVSDCIWWFKVPVGVGTTRGIFLYWASGAGVRRGDTHLQATAGTAGDQPVGKVETVRNANGYAAVKLFNGDGATA